MKKAQWSYQKYRDWLLGDAENNVPSLRSIFRGLDASEGFNLHDFDSWTSAQRKKIRKAIEVVDEFQSQETRMVRPRKKENLRRLQKQFHDKEYKGLKVAFVPDIEPQITLVGTRKLAPRIVYKKDSVVIKRKGFNRELVLFNQNRLAKDTSAELDRVKSLMPDAKLFYLKVGNHRTVNPFTNGDMENTIRKWMNQYDGVKELPRSSGNRGNHPKNHHWRDWLLGAYGIEFQRQRDIFAIAKKISAGRLKAKELKATRTRWSRRKGSKGRK